MLQAKVSQEIEVGHLPRRRAVFLLGEQNVHASS